MVIFGHPDLYLLLFGLWSNIYYQFCSLISYLIIETKFTRTCIECRQSIIYPFLSITVNKDSHRSGQKVHIINCIKWDTVQIWTLWQCYVKTQLRLEAFDSYFHPTRVECHHWVSVSGKQTYHTFSKYRLQWDQP